MSFDLKRYATRSGVSNKGVTKVTTEEKQDLLDESQVLTYEYIKISCLNGNMSNPDSDELAKAWAIKVDSLLHGLIAEEFDRVEAAAEAAERRVA